MSKKIMVVEGDEFQRTSMIDILTLLDYEVDAAESGELALEFLRANPSSYGLILMGMQMPRMVYLRSNIIEQGGLKCLEHIIKDKKLMDIPVIMMTAMDDREFVARSIESGARDYLVQPLRTEVIYQSAMLLDSTGPKKLYAIEPS